MGLQIGIRYLDKELRLGVGIRDLLGFGIEDWRLVLGIRDWDWDWVCDWDSGFGFEDLYRGLAFVLGIGIVD